MLALTDAHRRIVREILAAHLPADASVRAFGSRVKNSHRRLSDLDLAIKGRESLTLSQHANLAEAFSESDLPFKVDVVDWFSAPPFLQKIIERDGVSLPP